MNPFALAFVYVLAVVALFFACGMIGWSLRRAVETRRQIRRRLSDMDRAETARAKVGKSRSQF